MKRWCCPPHLRTLQLIGNSRGRAHRAILMKTLMDQKEEALSYGGVVLRRSDLDLLKGPHFLNDCLIEFYFNYLSNNSHHQFGDDKHHSSLSKDDILLVPPTLSFWLANSKDSESLKEFEESNEVLKKQVVIFTVNNNRNAGENDGGTHWSLLVFYRKSNTFVHYDSLGSMNRSDAWKLYKAVKKHVGMIDTPDSASASASASASSASTTITSEDHPSSTSLPPKMDSCCMRFRDENKSSKRARMLMMHRYPYYHYNRWFTPPPPPPPPAGHSDDEMEPADDKALGDDEMRPADDDYKKKPEEDNGDDEMGPADDDDTKKPAEDNGDDEMRSADENDKKKPPGDNDDDEQMFHNPWGLNNDEQRFHHYPWGLHHDEMFHHYPYRWEHHDHHLDYYSRRQLYLNHHCAHTNDDSSSSSRSRWGVDNMNDDPCFKQLPTPRQTNYYDCGLYVMAIARVICQWYYCTAAASSSSPTTASTSTTSSNSADAEDKVVVDDKGSADDQIQRNDDDKVDDGDRFPDIMKHIDTSLESTMRSELLALIQQLTCHSTGFQDYDHQPQPQPEPEPKSQQPQPEPEPEPEPKQAQPKPIIKELKN